MEISFLSEEIIATTPKRKLDGLAGKANLPDDFNEPLDDLKDYI